MRKYPTPWQYLVDIIAQGRLKAAYASGDRKAIAAADKNFRGLNEDEVVFEALPARKDGKLAYSLTSKVRGFKIGEIPFTTGSLAKMVKQNANLMAEHEGLATSQITGFYFCEDADQLHLLVHPNSNIHEALKMTGYEFEPQHYNAQMYAGRDAILQADGVVSIKHPVVAGEVYISYVQAYVPPAAPVAEEIAPASFQSELQEAPVTFATEPYSAEAPVIDETQGGQIDYVAPNLAEAAADKTVAIQEAASVVPVSLSEPEAPVAEEVVEETAEAVVEEAPVEEEKPAVNIQQKKKK